jgi:GntR family transcriptional regulator
LRASAPVPSAQVEQILRQRLREYPPGSRFSSELELCREFRVSRTLIRPILARFVKEGLLERKARLRTTVALPRRAARGPHLLDLIDGLHAYRPECVVKVIDITSGWASHYVKERLKLPSEAPITVVRRLVMVDGTPVTYMNSFLPSAVGEQLTKAELERQPLAHLLPRRLGIAIRKAMQTIEPVVADLEVARRLAVPVGAPLLLVERDFLGRGQTIVFHTRVFCRGDRYKFATTLRWNSPTRTPAKLKAARR